ncbi:MAG: ribosomal protein S18-alanine N-acetyltransferase [Elusimicrobia bacterium]|nr:ribosomal protein S18-alanine N-acetyltransferase [Elusimicrobiota bacterium]
MIEIKKCLIKYIDRICEIDKSSSSYNWNKQLFINELNFTDGNFNVLFVDNVIVGYIVYHTVIDEAEILNIVIDNKFKGQKYGTLLLKETIEKMKRVNIKTIFLEVGEKNIPAIALYKNFNFEKYNIREKYYKNGESAVLMKKIL